MHLKGYAAKTHQGPLLNINEDSYEFDFENNLFMVLDGFGGAGIGDKAVEILKYEIKEFFSNLSNDPNATMPLYYDPKNLLETNAIINALTHAHRNLYRLNLSKPLGLRAGASCIIAARADRILVIVGVGNCNAYLHRQGSLFKILTGESLILSSKDLTKFNSATTPLNTIGMYPEFSPQFKEVRLLAGDKVIFLTDGIYQSLSDEEILYCLNKSINNPNQSINDLLKLSNSRGNTDNQTAVILDF